MHWLVLFDQIFDVNSSTIVEGFESNEKNLKLKA